MSLIGNLTDMQWLHGIYGSVGEFGVSIGILASILTFNADDATGEKLVFSDVFKNPLDEVPVEEQFKRFVEIMDRLGVSFAEVKPAGKRRGYLYNMHPTLLSKDVFLDRNIPQLRLVSLNGHRDPMTVALALQTAACVLRDGGIVVVDGSNTATTRTAVEGYFRRFGSVSMAPLLDVGDKLYRSVYSELETHLHELYLYKQVGRPGCVCRHTGSPLPFIQGLAAGYAEYETPVLHLPFFKEKTEKSC